MRACVRAAHRDAGEQEQYEAPGDLEEDVVFVVAGDLAVRVEHGGEQLRRGEERDLGHRREHRGRAQQVPGCCGGYFADFNVVVVVVVVVVSLGVRVDILFCFVLLCCVCVCVCVRVRKTSVTVVKTTTGRL